MRIPDFDREINKEMTEGVKNLVATLISLNVKMGEINEDDQETITCCKEAWSQEIYKIAYKIVFKH